MCREHCEETSSILRVESFVQSVDCCRGPTKPLRSTRLVDCRALQTGDAGWARVRYRVQFLIDFSLFLFRCCPLPLYFLLGYYGCCSFRMRRARAPQNLVSNTFEARAKNPSGWWWRGLSMTKKMESQWKAL